MADRPPSPEDEDDAFWRSQVILDADDEKAGADLYPRLFNISTGMIYTAVLRTQDPERAGCVTIPLPSGWSDEESLWVPKMLSERLTCRVLERRTNQAELVHGVGSTT